MGCQNILRPQRKIGHAAIETVGANDLEFAVRALHEIRHAGADEIHLRKALERAIVQKIFTWALPGRPGTAPATATLGR